MGGKVLTGEFYVPGPQVHMPEMEINKECWLLH